MEIEKAGYLEAEDKNEDDDADNHIDQEVPEEHGSPVHCRVDSGDLLEVLDFSGPLQHRYLQGD